MPLLSAFALALALLVPGRIEASKELTAAASTNGELAADGQSPGSVAEAEIEDVHVDSGGDGGASGDDEREQEGETQAAESGEHAGEVRDPGQGESGRHQHSASVSSGDDDDGHRRHRQRRRGHRDDDDGGGSPGPGPGAPGGGPSPDGPTPIVADGAAPQAAAVIPSAEVPTATPNEQPSGGPTRPRKRATPRSHSRRLILGSPRPPVSMPQIVALASASTAPDVTAAERRRGRGARVHRDVSEPSATGRRHAPDAGVALVRPAGSEGFVDAHSLLLAALGAACIAAALMLRPQRRGAP